MSLALPALQPRLDAARIALQHLRSAASLPLELQLAICRTLYEIESLTVRITDGQHPG